MKKLTYLKDSYRVKLENYDEKWQEASNQNFANYTNLDPGHYTFRVQAANSDGVWNEEGIKLGVIIRSPWFWNIWSQLLYLLLILGALSPYTASSSTAASPWPKQVGCANWMK